MMMIRPLASGEAGEVSYPGVRAIARTATSRQLLYIVYERASPARPEIYARELGASWPS